MQRINYKVEELINQLPQKIDKQVFLQELNNKHPYYPIGHNMLLALLDKNDFTQDNVKQKATYFFDTKFLFDKNFNSFSLNNNTNIKFNDTHTIVTINEKEKTIENPEIDHLNNENTTREIIYNEVIDEEPLEVNDKIVSDSEISETVFDELGTDENTFVALNDLNSFSFFDKPNIEEIKNDNSLIEEVLNNSQVPINNNKPESIHDEIAATIAMFQSNNENGITQNKTEDEAVEQIHIEKTTEAEVEQLETINNTEQKEIEVITNEIIEINDPTIITKPETQEIEVKIIETTDIEHKEISNEKNSNELITEKVEINNNEQEKINTESEQIINTTEQETIIVELTVENPLDVVLKKEVVENEMIFEPLYVSDYFAATGVKISPKDFEKSNLMGKVQKFTEWLKMMKNIDSEKLANQLQPEREAEIKTIANKSNVREEILTEAMADIYAKQGKKDKAKVLFVKLSLLNPSKSTYFAAKINALEGSI